VAHCKKCKLNKKWRTKRVSSRKKESRFNLLRISMATMLVQGAACLPPAPNCDIETNFAYFVLPLTGESYFCCRSTNQPTIYIIRCAVALLLFFARLERAPRGRQRNFAINPRSCTQHTHIHIERSAESSKVNYPIGGGSDTHGGGGLINNNE